MVIRAIFFDFDGTISDSKRIAIKSLVQTLNEFGYDVDRKKLMELLGVKMARMLKLLKLSGGPKVDEKMLKKIKNRFYKHFTAAAIGGGIRPCVSLSPLWKLKEEGMPMFVVSNSKKSFLRASVKVLGIKGLFGRVYGAEDFELKDGMISGLIKKLGLKPREVVYVGDRFSDVDAAKKAGCVSVGIHNAGSFSTFDEIMRVGPDFLVRDFWGLRRVVLGNGG